MISAAPPQYFELHSRAPLTDEPEDRGGAPRQIDDHAVFPRTDAGAAIHHLHRCRFPVAQIRDADDRSKWIRWMRRHQREHVERNAARCKLAVTFASVK